MVASSESGGTRKQTRGLRSYLIPTALVGLVIVAVLAVALVLAWMAWVWFSPPPVRHGEVTPTSVWTTSSPTASLAFSPDGQLLAIGMQDGSVQVKRVSDRALLHTLRGDSDVAQVVAFSPDGKVLAEGGGPNDAAIRLWSVPEGSLLRTLNVGGFDGGFSVVTLSFSPDGQYVAAGGYEGIMRLWTIADGHLVSQLNGPPHQDSGPNGILRVTFSQDGTILSSGNTDGTVQQWSLPGGTLLHTYQDPILVHDPEWRGLSLDMSRDGRLVVTSGHQDPDVHTWELGSTQLLSTYREHSTGVAVVAFSPDGTLVATAGGYDITGSSKNVIVDNLIRVWEPASAKTKLVLDNYATSATALAWSPDGKLLASGDDTGTVRLWQIK